MTINYERLTKTPLYIMGRLNINGDSEYYDTLELTDSQLPGSLMKVTLLTPNSGQRILALVTDDFDYNTEQADSPAHCIGRISRGVSYRSLKDLPGIIIGVKDFPGSMAMSRKIYGRLVDRIEKCLQKPRHEAIQFIIRPTIPRLCPAHPFWLTDPMHGCPPTTLHCEANVHGDVAVYEGDTLVKIHTLKEQKMRYLSDYATD